MSAPKPPLPPDAPMLSAGPDDLGIAPDPRAAPLAAAPAENCPSTMGIPRSVGYLNRFVSAVLIAFVRLYQMTLSHLIGKQCRFEPTCSHYFIGAVRKHGPWRGTWRGICRIFRCHPFSPGGIDPP